MKTRSNQLERRHAGPHVCRIERWVRFGVLTLALTQAIACNSAPKAPTPEASHHEGSLNPPMVISGSPKRDSVGFNRSEEILSDADWAKLEKWGPRPVWEKVAARSREVQAQHEHDVPREKLLALRDHDDVRHPRCPAPPTIAPGGAALTQPGAGVALVNPLAPVGPQTASTQPASTQPALPTVAQAAAAAAMLPPISEADLPVQIIPLPDGKLRMIWVLRNYGGSSVASTRDPSTARRAVAITPPDLAPLLNVLTPTVGAGGTVLALPKENTLVITCDPVMKQTVLNVLSRLDIAPRQVEITAKIFEVSRDFDFQQGTKLVLNHLASDGSQSLISAFSAKRFLEAAAAPGTPVNGSVLNLMHAFAGAGISVDVSFQMLADAGMINVVSAPRMTVAVGQTGYLLAGQELPISSANLVNNILQTTTVYKPVGVQMYITPQAVGDGTVKLHTISIVSSISGFSPLPTMDGNRGATSLLNPIIDSREAETQVTVSDGDTLVISGLRMVRTISREEKIPGLGDVPALGWLFKNHRSQQQQTDLYFFVTPTLLETAAAE